MRPTIPRLLRIIPRSQLKTESPSTKPIRPLPPPPTRSDVKRPTLIQVLQQRQKEAGDNFPPNLRIEAELTKRSFKGVPAEIREELKEVVRER
ncbi:hypothetical protein NLI96_g7584 [Meripilus lineatus]|uniref:Uncharacterized protein n=1 Tax=Meripilus lineatus TaxID=2056292 RepID=A0AAD5V133_9APHY|nr:hypothetical protein NLI96_g7584 [Physisporinus lineatus]